jgi:hypothetical protein
MFRLYVSHLQALKGQIHTISEHCIVGSPTLKIIVLYNKEILRMAVLLVTDNNTIQPVICRMGTTSRVWLTVSCLLPSLANFADDEM